MGPQLQASLLVLLSSSQAWPRGLPVPFPPALTHLPARPPCPSALSALQFLTLCALAQPGAYTDANLLVLIELLCRAGLDMGLRLLPKTDLQQLLLLLLENIQEWPGKVPQPLSQSQSPWTHARRRNEVLALLTWPCAQGEAAPRAPWMGTALPGGHRNTGDCSLWSLVSMIHPLPLWAVPLNGLVEGSGWRAAPPTAHLSAPCPYSSGSCAVP